MSSYNDLVNIPSFGKKKENFITERGTVQFYCRDCRAIVETERLHPQRYDYACTKCKGRNISLGTTEGLKEFYSA